ncbi:MAG: hypothetical protein DRR19_02275 [Candidatus Parabeggiatoa sp. nov. 1]|nr:MAG: hypothetical protein DRR19_02275 [Gammaproteobacteria bacterium]
MDAHFANRSPVDTTSLFPCVRHSTLVSVQTGTTLARVTGELTFEHRIVLIVREYLQIHNELPVTFHWYGYEVWRDEEKLYSYRFSEK